MNRFFSSKDAFIRHYSVSNSDRADFHRVGILLENRRDEVLDFGGDTLIFRGQTMAFAIDGCKNITIRNAVVDWDMPFSAEGIILSASKEGVLVAFDREKYPHHTESGRLIFDTVDGPSAYFGAMEFDSSTRRVREGAGDTFPRIHAETSPEGPMLSGAFDPVPQPGNLLVLRHGKRTHPGLFCRNSKNIRLENVTFHATCGLGALFQFCENITIDGVSFVPGPGRQVLSGHDDGLHFSNCRGHISVENCRFQGLMDDSINVHGTSTRILSMDGTCVIGRFCHPQSLGFDRWAAPGDRISFLKKSTMDSLGAARVHSFTLLSQEDFRLELDSPLPPDIHPGDAMENLTNTPDFTCRRCFFGSCRARGLLVTTPGRVLIEHNRFESSGTAILLSGDANEWYESGACRDVTIRRNVFTEHCLSSRYQFCDAVITLHPEIKDREHSQGFHQNILITENEFHDHGVPLLYEHCTKNLRFENNRIL